MKFGDNLHTMEMQFGERLKTLRLSRAMSQKDLADEFNVSSQTVSAWEKGLQQTDFETLCQLALFFDVTADFLLGLSET